MKFVLLSVLLTSCSSARIPTLSEMTIRPGEVRWVELGLPGQNVRLFCRDNEVKVQRSNGLVQAVVVESYFSDKSPFTCTFKENEKILHDIIFRVEHRDYKEEQLKVDLKRIKLSPKDQKRADEEQLILNQIYASSSREILFKKSFSTPMNSLVTSLYGTRRLYNKSKKSQHLGIDYRAAIGENVPATNSGKVVFSGDLFYTGYTVIIDHGLDIFSVYGHLSKTLVEAGQMVNKSQIIGLSGNTGRTSGPHLHWGVKIQGQYIDGLALIDETKKTFKE